MDDIRGEEIVLTLRRGEETFDVSICPVEYSPDEYRLGIWVRDNIRDSAQSHF